MTRRLHLGRWQEIRKWILSHRPCVPHEGQGDLFLRPLDVEESAKRPSLP